MSDVILTATSISHQDSFVNSSEWITLFRHLNV